MPRYLAATVLTLLVLAAPAQAETIFLDFNLGLADLDPIPQTYGDGANVDATYSVRLGFGSSPLHPAEVPYYWSTGYSGTTDVSWTGFDTVWELFLEPTAGYQITLNSFSLHSWEDGFYTDVWNVWDADFNLLSSGVYASDSFTVFSPGVTSTNGIRLQFGPDPLNVGIDNISFDVSEIPPPPPPPPTVPEPSTLILLGGGLLAGARRRLMAIRRARI
jgi:hypothetical protein